MKERKGRTLERLVSDMERALGRDVEIKSPDRLRDVDTGALREVDVSIRGRCGTIDVLVIVECRDRKRVDDTTWIEHLISKQKSVGATKTVAVSATGFARQALEKARAHGIETRTLKKLRADDIKGWMQASASVINRSYTLLGGEIVIAISRAYEEPIEANVEGTAGIPERIFRVRGETAELNILELFDRLRDSQAPKGEAWVEKEFDAEECLVKTNVGDIPVTRLRLGFAIAEQRHPLERVAWHEYADSEKILGRRVELAGALAGVPISLVVTTKAC